MDKNIWIEIFNNIYIGSIGASMNKNILEEYKITHILIAGNGLKAYFPEVI